MGEALISALLKEGIARADGVTVSDVAEVRRQHLASEYGVRVTADSVEAAQGADLVVLAVKPQEFPALAAAMRGHLGGGQTVLTIMAGLPIGRGAEALGHDASDVSSDRIG